MKIYFAGIPAGDGKIEYRECELLKIIDHRLISYHFVLNKAHPIKIIEEGINERNRNIPQHRRRG